MAMNPRLLAPRATGFNPKSISGLTVWIDFSDASSVTLDGSSKISAVNDKSGNGYNGAQTTAGNRPGVSTLNGRQCLDNGTSSNSFRIGYTHGSTTLNLQDGYIAASWDAGGTTFPVYNGLASSPGLGTAGGVLWLGFEGLGLVYPVAAWHASGGSRMSINNTTALNGANLSAFPAITSSFVTRGSANSAITANGWQLGNDRDFAGRGWRGRIGEMLIYNRQLSASEALKVRRYLASKWGAPDQT